MPLYYAHFVVVEENLWLRRGAMDDLIRKEVLYRVHSQLFSAGDAEQAYVRAVGMISGLEDSHNDGPGERTNFKCLGIHDLDEVSFSESSLSEALDGPYGIDVGVMQFDVDVPTIPPRAALSLFSRFIS